MPSHPVMTMPATLLTQRLKLRAPVCADASRIAMFIGDWDVARMLEAVPHPYNEADAIRWIDSPFLGQRWVMVHANGVIGAVGLELKSDGAVALGYWLAKPFWGRGLVTEAALTVINAARCCGPTAVITSGHFADNPASQRVLQKLGFVATGDIQIRSRSRNAEVRLLTYRLPVAAATAAIASASPPELTPA
jgi:RimJ/RimL family protein N-acetyltransferase